MTDSAATLVCFAVKEEARPFQRLVSHRSDIQVLLTGMGRHNAEKTFSTTLAHQRPQRVITAGFAGGLHPELARGDIVYFADETVGLVERLGAAGAKPGRFHCSERVIATAIEKRGLHLSTRADAVEMESLCIYKLCVENQVPAAIVRVILDTASEDLVLDFNKLMTPDYRIDSGKLAIQLLKSPWKIPALVRLQRQSSTAATHLGQLLAKVLQL